MKDETLRTLIFATDVNIHAFVYYKIMKLKQKYNGNVLHLWRVMSIDYF